MSFEIVCFDCDSTLSKIEGIDELGRQSGLYDELVALTNAAMNGTLALEDVYGKRLSLIKPDKAQITSLADLYIAEIVDGVEEVFSTLLTQGKLVHIISGGLRQAILPLAEKLGIPADHVHAVDVLFNVDGSFKDFDQQSPLARTGGKAVICQSIQKQGYSMAMIGDGKTDLEAKQAGATVIGFGGVMKRDIVVEQADVFVNETSLMAVLPHLA
jgi:phosphoserine phosphatase